MNKGFQSCKVEGYGMKGGRIRDEEIFKNEILINKGFKSYKIEGFKTKGGRIRDDKTI